jgi:hypothetical protein
MQPPDELRDGTRQAGWLNKLLAFVKTTRLVEGVGYELNQTTRGVSLVIRPGKSTSVSSTAKRYRVKSIGDDTVVANEILSGGGVSATDTTIAKPFNLRRTGWHGVSMIYETAGYPGNPGFVTIVYNYLSAFYRTATVTTDLGTTTEHQVITPYYQPGFSEIVAAEPEGGTGVNDTTLMDMNTDGRAWARAV